MMKCDVKAVNKDGNGFSYLSNKLLRINEADIKMVLILIRK